MQIGRPESVLGAAGCVVTWDLLLLRLQPPAAVLQAFPGKGARGVLVALEHAQNERVGVGFCSLLFVCLTPCWRL